MTHQPRRPSPGRCALVGLAAWGTAGALVWLAAPQLGLAAAEPGRSGFVGRLVELCSLATALCGLWLAVVATCLVVDAARLRAPRRLAGCPRPVQRWLLSACGAALVAGLATPAVAADRRPERPPAVRVQPVEGLPLPDRAVAGPPPGDRPNTPLPSHAPRRRQRRRRRWGGR